MQPETAATRDASADGQTTMTSPTTPAAAPAPSLTLGDVYYVIFRHKWKIIVCSLLGFAVAATVYKFQPPLFQCRAKLFVRYVIAEGKALGPVTADATKSPDQRGETIMNSEVEILTSLDLAKQVAEAVGAEKILAKVGGGNDLNLAASVIATGLTVSVPENSSIINLVFKHKDPTIVQPVLREIVDRYLKMHDLIHRGKGMLVDFLIQETDQLRSRLQQTDDDLRKARGKAGGVFSLEESKKIYTEQIARLRQDAYAAEAELAERTSVLQQLNKSMPAEAPAPAAAAPAIPPTDKIDEYKSALTRVAQLQKLEQEFLIQYTDENPRVQDIRTQLTAAVAAKRQLEEEFPAFARSAAEQTPVAAPTAPSRQFDQVAAAAQIIALQAKIKVLNTQLAELRDEATKLDAIEGEISQLRRKKELDEVNYRYFAASQEQARISETLGNGRVSNISVIQTPSPPSVDWTKTYKMLAAIFVGGIGAGLGWAFLIELVLDRSIRRPVDVQRMLRLPLLIAIPTIKPPKRRRLRAHAARALAAAETHANGEHPAPTAADALPAAATANGTHRATSLNGVHGTNGNGTNGTTTPYSDIGSAAQIYYETLRDRLIGYFESRNLVHRPKLIAVTGIQDGAGVTATAAGLARSLSETGDGNVLLVDMTIGQGSAQQFVKGKALCGLDELLDASHNAHVEQNLYVVAENNPSDRLSRNLPQRFTKLVPKLKASDFDYIIFDMPAVSQISITPRMAGFMDIVLLVLEAEKSDRDVIQRASELLANSKTYLGVVLNKTRNYVPRRLHSELMTSS